MEAKFTGLPIQLRNITQIGTLWHLKFECECGQVEGYDSETQLEENKDAVSFTESWADIERSLKR